MNLIEKRMKSISDIELAHDSITNRKLELENKSPLKCKKKATVALSKTKLKCQHDAVRRMNAFLAWETDAGMIQPMIRDQDQPVPGVARSRKNDE